MVNTPIKTYFGRGNNPHAIWLQAYSRKNGEPLKTDDKQLPMRLFAISLIVCKIGVNTGQTTYVAKDSGTLWRLNNK